MRFVLIVPCGPRPSCLLGFSEICESAAIYSEGAQLEIWSINDGNDSEALAAAAIKNGLAHRILPHPFAGKGHHWLGRITAGLVYGMRLAAVERPGWHVLRLDTDALIIGPWEKKLNAAAQDPLIGMIGSNAVGNEGRVMTGDWWHTRLYRHSRWISRADEGPGVRVAWTKASRVLTRTIRTALRHGRRSVNNINGGIYLLPAHAISRLIDMPLFRAEVCFQVDSFTEDVVVGICVYALGLKFLTQNEPGDAIASAWKGLAAPTLPELAARGCSIIHSLKDHPPFQEMETRKFFRARRWLAAKPSAQPFSG